MNLSRQVENGRRLERHEFDVGAEIAMGMRVNARQVSLVGRDEAKHVPERRDDKSSPVITARRWIQENVTTMICVEKSKADAS